MVTLPTLRGGALVSVKVEAFVTTAPAPSKKYDGAIGLVAAGKLAAGATDAGKPRSV
jgi:hypothetical protein